MATRLTQHSSATRPIRLTGYVLSQARMVWQHVELFGRPGVSREFLGWLNCQLTKRGKPNINMAACTKCKDQYWILGPIKGFRCDDCQVG